MQKSSVKGRCERQLGKRSFPNTKESSRPQNGYEHLHAFQAWEILLKFQVHKWIDLGSGSLAALFYYGKSVYHRSIIVYHSSASAEPRPREHMWLCPSLEEGNQESFCPLTPCSALLFLCSSHQSQRGINSVKSSQQHRNGKLINKARKFYHKESVRTTTLLKTTQLHTRNSPSRTLSQQQPV